MRSFSRIGKIVTNLTVAVVNFEGRSGDLNDLIAVHIFDFWRFSTQGKLS